MFDVEGWAGDLFMLGPGHQQHPEEAPSCGERWSKDKVGMSSSYLVPPSGSSSPLRGARGHRTPLTPRVGGLVTSEGRHNSKMEPCDHVRSRSPSPYDYKKEFEKWKQLQAEELKRFAPNDVWGRV